MYKKIGLGILITIFLISGLGSMGTEQAIYNEISELPDADVNGANFDEELVEIDQGAESNIESPMSTRAIDIDLKDIEWSKMINNRKALSYQIKRTRYSDLNHDGLVDIVDGGGYGLFVSFQNPDGTWYSMNTGLPNQASSNYDIYDIEVRDMNCDGWDDIVSINYTSNAGGDRPIIYLNNNGTGWTGQYSLGFEKASNSRGLTVNDFNNDNIPDIAYLGSGSGAENKVVIYLQDPIGTWTKSQTFDSLSFVFANSMSSFDYNNDAKIDIIAGGETYGKFYIFTNNNGSGINWTKTQLQAPSASKIVWGYLLSIYTADLNLDGYQDIVFGVYPSNDRNIITMYYNGTSWNEHLGNLPYFGNYADFHIADINFDGKPDITASGDGGLDVFLGDANYNWTQINQGLSSDSIANCMADIDNDGVLEIVDSDGLYDTIGLDNLYIKNFNKLTSNLPLGESFSFSHGDVNHDGLLDLLALRDKGVSANNVIVYTNKGDGTWKFYSAPSSSTTGIVDGELADMDNDGDLDIIYASEMWYNNVILVRNAGDGTFPGNKEEIYSVPKVSNRGGRAYSVDYGDVDLDGDFDLITAHRNNRNILWLNDGDGNFTSLGTIFGRPRAYSIGSEDLDGDGDYDVVFGQMEGSGGNTIYFNE